MFINPSISSDLARDRRRELLAQASRQHPAGAGRTEFNQPGTTILIRIAFAAAVLAAVVLGLATAHGDQDHMVRPAGATVSRPVAQPDDEMPKEGTVTISLTADEHVMAPATGKRQHQPLVQQVRDNSF
jgi:hypothetical protein